jgi:hypothetical protein
MPTELNVIISATPSPETVAPNEPQGWAFAGHARLETTTRRACRGSVCEEDRRELSEKCQNRVTSSQSPSLGPVLRGMGAVLHTPYLKLDPELI